MREQQNPSTPELHQPLLFAPSELLACGLRDAHHHPLVGVRTEDGVRSWRTSPATEWEHPLVEWARTAYLKELETTHIRVGSPIRVPFRRPVGPALAGMTRRAIPAGSTAKVGAAAEAIPPATPGNAGPIRSPGLSGANA